MTAAPRALEGWTVAVTSARRGIDLTALLAQHGARVIHTPAVRILPLEDTEALQLATTHCLSQPFDITVVTTGSGYRTWLEAADGNGCGEPLRQALASSVIVTRGPKASGAVHASGLTDATSPPCESTWDILERLLSRDLRGTRIVVQLPGTDLGDFTRALRTAGAEVLEVPVYRTGPPADGQELERLVDHVLSREVQAVTFTSAAASANLLAAAARTRRQGSLLQAFDDVLAVCVGSVAAAPLERLEVRTVQPGQARVGALVHAIVAELEARRAPLRVAGHDLEVRGHGALVDGAFRPLAPAPMAVLRALARHPGRVIPLSDLRLLMPAGGEERAAEMAVSRLRQGLGDPRCIGNVIKRGYRLSAELPVGQSDDRTRARQPSELLASVGGTSGLRAAVDLLYARLVEDPLVAHHFLSVDLPRLKRHQVLMLASLLGGPSLYSGRDLVQAHQGLSICLAEYVCVLDHLTDVLGELGVPAQGIETVRDVLTALQDEVVAPTPSCVTAPAGPGGLRCRP